MPAAVAALAAALGGSACRQDMHDQPRVEPYEASTFFGDRRGSRPLVPGTVARGELAADDAIASGRRGDAPLAEVPVPVTIDLLRRGRQRYDIYCAPCHDRLGTGRGMVVRRGYRQPPSLHIERLRQAPAGHLYDVVANGFGAMPSYSAQVPVADRWAIVAYVRALQLAQAAPLDMVPASQRAALAAAPGAAASGAAAPETRPDAGGHP